MHRFSLAIYIWTMPLWLTERLLSCAQRSLPQTAQSARTRVSRPGRAHGRDKHSSAMAVGIRTGDPDAALRAVHMADLAWASGDPKVEGTWAQIRFGAGIVHIMKGDLDATLSEATPAFDLAPEFRMATIMESTCNPGVQHCNPASQADHRFTWPRST